MFTYEFWLSELHTYDSMFTDPEVAEDVLVNCVKGITFVASHTIDQNPELRHRITQQYIDAMLAAASRMGLDWVTSQAAIIAAHGGPNILPT